MSGSFWKFSNGFTSLSNISTLLEEENNKDQFETLLNLLNENDLLQELLSNNPVLLDFLRQEQIITYLVDLVINDGKIPEDKELPKNEKIKDENGSEEDEDEKEEEEEDEDDEVEEDEEEEEDLPTKRATLATEILSADVWSLTDTVMESTTNLNKLWDLLDSKVSLYFIKIMEHLLDMKCDETITYLIENQPNLVEKFMKHLSNPPLMDFLLKLISIDKPDNSTGMIDFLQNQNLIDNLLANLEESSDVIKAIITISANSSTDSNCIGPNELTRQLVSYSAIENLCKQMLDGGIKLANGVGIIIEIIRKNNSDYDVLPVLYITLESHPPTGRDPIYLGHLLKVFGQNIKNFNDLLVKNNETKLKTPFGDIEPLGFERFKICELIAELLHCSNMALLNDPKGYDVVKERDELRNKMKEFDPVSFKYNEVIVMEHESKEHNNEDPVIGDFLKIALYDTQIISNILSMFFKFPWNNFLHNVVFDIVQQILNGSMDIGYNKYLTIDLFTQGDLTNKIIEGQKLCDDYEKTNGLRLGFMGHLTLIAEEVVKFVQLYPDSFDLINEKVESEKWEDYVSHVLYDTREKYNAILGGDEDTFEEGLGEIIEEVKTG
ncbi:unnamed protein product [Candida verbasci]|uniref:Extragenic suppressor of kinetochore protein 1 n=1 Tax=Candida verbasci TaxID=1227364 RepID=A0A9W4XCF5_9ASCO|nr:unnamed protein product [Candida verbasci]